MLFNSTEFLFLFLPVVLLVFILLSRTGSTRAQAVWLVLASVVFYGSWNPAFVLLIVASVMVNFFIGRRLAGRAAGARVWLVTGVTLNLGLLGYFKYAGFFVENLSALGLWLIPVPEIVLPLAISFFTFQQIAYLVDVYRGECEEYHFIQYALFVVFFPQLIAGPIVHHKEMMPQFGSLRRREDLWPDLAVGLTILSIGLFKKVVLADSLSAVADPLFSATERGVPLSTVDAWVATFGFAFQIYFDFSGYSDMAIGSARLFGIHLPENFASPYKSASIIEFWRRWHMTLSRFLRDYLYFSLGGNRKGSVMRYRNLMITMLLGGLWHGAAWTFVIWGGMHGLFLCINHGWRALCDKTGFATLRRNAVLRPLNVFLTTVAAAMAFVVFRATDVDGALGVIVPAFTPLAEAPAPLLYRTAADTFLGQMYIALGLGSYRYLPVYTLLSACAFICWFMPNTQQYMRRFEPVIRDRPDDAPRGLVRVEWRPGWGSAVTVALLLGAGLLSLSAVTEFIYFQF
jgi:D-alanyl-lipoteichoic acid acyltransferase DltB (MBOAT superfamily)